MTETVSAVTALSTDLERLVATVAPSVVAVHSHRSRSSGYVWRPGLIVTADEALSEEGEITVAYSGGRTVPATLAGRDPTTDIALLRVDADLTPAGLPADVVALGSLSLVVGSRAGEPLASLGIVGFTGPGWRSLRGGEINARVELDMSLPRQAEGGLVSDAAGRPLGMAVFGPRRRVLVIPAATIDRVAATLATDGRISRGYLGLGLHPVRLETGGIGAMVMSVDADGPGSAAGLTQGDVILAWDGQPIDDIQTLLRALGPDSVGRIVSLSTRRGGQANEVELTVGRRLQT